MNNRLDELQSIASRYIKTIAMDIVVVLVAAAYILYQMVTLEPTEVNPLVLIAQAFVGIVCGITIKQALGENGFSRGYNSTFWKEEEDKYNRVCATANPYMERVENFYQYEEIDKKKNYRRAKLQGIRLKYKDWFDSDGNYIGEAEAYNKLDKRQKRILRKCIRIKIYILNLFGHYDTSVEQSTKKEKTDKEQRAKNLSKNTFTATAIAIIGVYFVPMLNNWSWASFISSTLQVAMWVLFGILQLYTNYNFVTQERTAILRQKKETIQRFTSGCEKGLYITSPYDEKPLQKEETQKEEVKEESEEVEKAQSFDENKQ